MCVTSSIMGIIALIAGLHTLGRGLGQGRRGPVCLGVW